MYYNCSLSHSSRQSNIHHHHHVVLVARISLTLSLHFSLSFMASGRSSGQHPVSSHSCCMYVRAGRPAFARPCVGVDQYILEAVEIPNICLNLFFLTLSVTIVSWTNHIFKGWPKDQDYGGISATFSRILLLILPGGILLIDEPVLLKFSNYSFFYPEQHHTDVKWNE